LKDNKMRIRDYLMGKVKKETDNNINKLKKETDNNINKLKRGKK